MANTIPTFDFKAGLPLEIELMPVSRIIHQHRRNAINSHRTNFYHIFWVTAGTPVHTVDFMPIAVQPNSLLFVNKNRVQLFDHSHEYDGQVLVFTDAFFNRTPLDSQLLRNTSLFTNLLSIPLVRLDQALTDLRLIWQQLQHELEQPADSSQAQVLRNLLQNLLLLADRERHRQTPAQLAKGIDLDHTLRFTDLLEEQFSRFRSVRQYATQMSITERRLQQATTAALGKTPKQIINERSVLEAKRLLVYTNQSIKEIGFLLGFEEPTNFIRFFHLLAGQTPADFRRMHP